MGNQVSFRGGLPNIPSLCLTADEGVKGIVGQGRMGVSGLGVFIAAARGVRGGSWGGKRGVQGGQGGAGRGRNGWHTTPLAQPPSLQPGSGFRPIFLKPSQNIFN